jgi:dienelactone hydrolase
MQPLVSAASVCFAAVLFSSGAIADVVEQRVEYRDGGVELIGFEYSDSAMIGKTPGVIVFSDWMGVGPFAKERAAELVKLGYRVFVADIYGDGKIAKDATEAGLLATPFKKDRVLFRSRAKAAFDTLTKNALVDKTKVAAIGFCFGGTASLELARSGAPLAGLVSFHGGLDSPDPAAGKNIKGRILILHGADDPYISEADMKAFIKELKDNRINWELTEYSGAVHAFTNPAAGSDNSKGAAFNATVAKRSYMAMRDFLLEIFSS